jgi:enoyl-CoA hydratase/carnithine racemase
MPRSFVASNRIAWLQEAQRIGLVSYSYPQARLRAEALKLATKIASNGYVQQRVGGPCLYLSPVTQ